MKRPLLPILAGLICGILCQHLGGQPESWLTLPSAYLPCGGFCFLLAVGLWNTCRPQSSPFLATLILLSLAFLTGMSRYAAATGFPAHHLMRLVQAGERVTIEGFLYKPPEQVGAKQYIYLHVLFLEKASARYTTTGKIRLVLTNGAFGKNAAPALAYGDTVRTRLKLVYPQNFSDFDYRAYLQRQGIGLIGTLAHDRYLIRLPVTNGSAILRWIYALRTDILRFLQVYENTHRSATTDQPERLRHAIQLIKAMALGAGREISREVGEPFRNAGVYHILVVSGVHISILTYVVHRVFKWLRIPFCTQIFLLAGILLFYTALIGFQYPVLRSVIMAFVLYAAFLAQRIPDSLYSLAFSVALILGLFPTALYDASFQLTVAATMPILIVFWLLKNWHWLEIIMHWPFFVRIPVVTSLTTVAATIGLAPLLMAYFGTISPYSLIANLLTLPLASVFLPFSLAAIFLSLIVHPWSLLDPLVAVNVFLANLLIDLTTWFPPFTLTLPRPSWLLIGLYYLAWYALLRRYARPRAATSP